jgi:uncharacterized protein
MLYLIRLILQAMPVTHSTRTPNTLPITTVDLNAFCDAGKSLTGQSPASEFGALDDDAGGSLQPVDWHIQGTSKPVVGAQYDKTVDTYYRFIQLKANTQMKATCGRCLNEMVLSLAVDAQLQVFQTDEAADQAAMATDADTSPDPIVSSRTFDLLDQVQEELLLAMPENPTHADGDASCMLPVVVNTVQSSAFAVLASLKKAK